MAWSCWLVILSTEIEMASFGMPLFLIADSTGAGKKSFANETWLCVIKTKLVNINKCLLNGMPESYSLISIYVHMLKALRQSFLIAYLSESGQCTGHKKEGGEVEASWLGIAHTI